jgi:endo-1,3-1,4-beta-glycanase ExoK
VKPIKWVLGVLCAVLLVAVVRPAAAKAAAAPGVITWKGYEWKVRTWGGGPGPAGQWSASNVSVDSAGRLHLTVTRTKNELVQAELDSVQQGWGYGTYSWKVDSDLTTFHPDHVLGLFTYGVDPAYGHREIDIEASGWGGTPVSWDYTVWGSGQNSKVPGPVSPGASAHQFTWEPGKVTWTSWDAIGAVLYTHSTTVGVPVPGDEMVMMNLWVFGGPGWNDAPAMAVILSDFTFRKAATSAA